MNSELDKPMTYLKGVGPKRAETYEKMGIKTVYDLLCHYPRDYIDLTVTTPISDAPINEQSVIRCTVVRKLPEARIRKGLSVFKAVVTDGTADLTVVIYNSSFLFASLKLDEQYFLIGKVTGTFIRKEMNSRQGHRHVYPQRDELAADFPGKYRRKAPACLSAH